MEAIKLFLLSCSGPLSLEADSRNALEWVQGSAPPPWRLVDIGMVIWGLLSSMYLESWIIYQIPLQNKQEFFFYLNPLLKTLFVIDIFDASAWTGFRRKPHSVFFFLPKIWKENKILFHSIQKGKSCAVQTPALSWWVPWKSGMSWFFLWVPTSTTFERMRMFP